MKKPGQEYSDHKQVLHETAFHHSSVNLVSGVFQRAGPISSAYLKPPVSIPGLQPCLVKEGSIDHPSDCSIEDTLVKIHNSIHGPTSQILQKRCGAVGQETTVLALNCHRFNVWLWKSHLPSLGSGLFICKFRKEDVKNLLIV